MEPTSLPTYKDFLIPVLQAVQSLGGTAHAKEVSAWIVEQSFDDDAVAVEYPNRPGESILLDRIAWARSYDKLGGLVETPQRGLYVLTAEGKRVLTLPDTEARQLVEEMDRQIRKARDRKKRKVAPPEPDQERDPEPLGSDSDEEADNLDLKAELLARLHALTPPGFEDFVVHLLKSYGMELTRTGGPSDEGSTPSGSLRSATCCPIASPCRSSGTTPKALARTSSVGTWLCFNGTQRRRARSGRYSSRSAPSRRRPGRPPRTQRRT